MSIIKKKIQSFSSQTSSFSCSGSTQILAHGATLDACGGQTVSLTQWEQFESTIFRELDSFMLFICEGGEYNCSKRLFSFGFGCRLLKCAAEFSLKSFVPGNSCKGAGLAGVVPVVVAGRCHPRFSEPLLSQEPSSVPAASPAAIFFFGS